ncbi:MAG: DUF502 domain-containing protein [Flavobacteriales bacterium]|nr:DUF502 domain-containing protein [Flavobacteriales bacterium]
MRKSFVKIFVNYVLNGLVIMLPVFGTAYIMYELLSWLDGIVPRLFTSSEELKVIDDAGGRKFSGWGILTLVVILFVMGYLGSLFINDRIRLWFGSLIERVPGINNVYRTISDILSAFVGSKKRFNQPVLVKVSEQMDMEMIGFVTDTDLSELGDIPGKVAVYFPMSFSLSGHLMLVPVKNIKRIERNAVDVMKYTMSAGVVEIDVDSEKR